MAWWRTLAERQANFVGSLFPGGRARDKDEHVPTHDELVAVAHHATMLQAASGRTSLSGVVSDLAQPVQAVDASLPIGDVNVVFRDSDLSCVVVRGGSASSRVGIVMRDTFTRTFTGRLGYGRAMLEHKPVSVMTDWAPLVVEPGAHVAEVAARAMARDAEHRYDDVLVQDTRWCATSTATITRSLLAALSERSTHDPLTRLKTRAALWYALARRCEAGRVGDGHFLLLFDVERLHHINISYGLAAGDAVLVEVASRLVRALPQGGEAGRVGGDVFAVMTSLPVADETQAASVAEALRQRFAGALVQPPGHLPPGAWPGVRVVAAWSAGGISAETLILHAEALMRERRLSVLAR